jgi:iron-sulfur cluster repair protein YtfE (RIC family)
VLLTRIGKRSPTGQNVVDRLLDCHQRIRSFCALALRLAGGAPPEQARDAAQQLVRYFTIGLPLHVADEDESIRPRLAPVARDDVETALATMSREHRQIEELVDELVRRWRALAETATPAACAATALGARSLDEHMRVHLAAEETIVFPALARLSLAQSDAILAEMQARRR